MQWYYIQQGKQIGPVEEAEIKRLISDGRLKPTDYVWNPDMGSSWNRITNVETFVSVAVDQTQQAEKKDSGLRLKKQEEPPPKTSEETRQWTDAIKAQREAKQAGIRRFWGYSCPECGGRVHRDHSEGAQKWFGVAGALLYMAFGSLYCDNCGEIKRREFPAWDRFRLIFGSLMLVFTGIAVVILCIYLLKYVDNK
jgi:hypothetical protein